MSHYFQSAVNGCFISFYVYVSVIYFRGINDKIGVLNDLLKLCLVNNRVVHATDSEVISRNAV